jgi:hypothetical protein
MRKLKLLWRGIFLWTNFVQLTLKLTESAQFADFRIKKNQRNEYKIVRGPAKIF